jgi:exosortase
MWNKWLNEPEYSHGYLVPGFALLLLFLRRSERPTSRPDSDWVWLPLILVGLGLRLLASVIYFQWLETVSFVVCLAGIAAVCGGRPALRWAGPSLAFLLFMIPLPYSVETAFARPLQLIATRASVYVIRTAGIPALPQGNIIVLPNGRLGVEHACSGLSMLLVFLATSTAVITLVRRPIFDKLVIVASAVPIAVLANVSRISATGVLQELFGKQAAQLVFHDWAGFLMMPFALTSLAIELWLISCLLRSPKAELPNDMAMLLTSQRIAANRAAKVLAREETAKL